MTYLKFLLVCTKAILKKPNKYKWTVFIITQMPDISNNITVISLNQSN